MGGLHQLRNRKFSEHFVFCQVHKLELLLGLALMHIGIRPDTTPGSLAQAI